MSLDGLPGPMPNFLCTPFKYVIRKGTFYETDAFSGSRRVPELDPVFSAGDHDSTIKLLRIGDQFLRDALSKD